MNRPRIPGRVAALAALALSVPLLAGCVVVPAPYHHPYHRSGVVVVEPPPPPAPYYRDRNHAPRPDWDGRR